MAPRIAVALLDEDMAPLAVSFNPELVREVASRLAAEKELPAPRTLRYSLERRRWMLLRELAGEDPGADPPDDALMAWKFAVDTPESDLPKEDQ
jgi:hypothetical protein